jgi:hypothetical protein
MEGLLMTPYINQAIFFAFAIALCVGVVLMLFGAESLLFSACRVVRRMWK